MTRLRFLSAAAILALTAGTALAQTPAASPTPAKPATAVTAPAPVAPAPAVATPAKPAAQATAPAPATPAVAAVKKLDLNTATEGELDKLPQIGPARAKAIVEARAKAKFKDWSDFDTRNVVPQNAEAAIKDLVIVR